ncbi:SCO2523 family variant P-loop protein [Actinospica robiniae]|uniref:SCO2523 family variant P-loop protein n=1 Tax=Actinospica robiniae TaxID=304901 RepID=UPI00041CC19A|nr:SCO2523 family variant P-loop protein [Actinospica robiniae]
MIVFATSDKGGTGRSVTSCNIAYRRALMGDDVAYLDFDFGSPTAGAVFDIPKAERGVDSGDGLHSYFLRGKRPQQLEVAAVTDNDSLRDLRRRSAGRLVLIPGDLDGGEFDTRSRPGPRGRAGRGEPNSMAESCARLLVDLDNEFDFIIVDLSAGRSYAVDLVLEATALPQMDQAICRWLVFHRWTRQHIIAAEGLVFGRKGLIEGGVDRGHDRETLRKSLRYVRTAVVNLKEARFGAETAAQESWLREYDRKLTELADQKRLGRANTAGQIPFDPVLQWREQIVSNADVEVSKVANQATVRAFVSLAENLSNETLWEDW